MRVLAIKEFSDMSLPKVESMLGSIFVVLSQSESTFRRPGKLVLFVLPAQYQINLVFQMIGSAYDHN